LVGKLNIVLFILKGLNLSRLSYEFERQRMQICILEECVNVCEELKVCEVGMLKPKKKA
jgi:hypothetical protein